MTSLTFAKPLFGNPFSATVGMPAKSAPRQGGVCEKPATLLFRQLLDKSTANLLRQQQEMLRQFAPLVGSTVAPHIVSGDQIMLGEVVMETQIYPAVGQKLKVIRRTLGVSESQIASMLRLSRQTLHNWENPGRQDRPPHQSKLQALNELMKFAMIWEKCNYSFEFGEFIGSEVDGKSIGDLIQTSSDRIIILLNYIHGLAELASSREKAREEKQAQDRLGYSFSEEFEY